ncbi:EAL domain-containing protein [Rheinheimera sp.]|uniref:EAL domain-containing protein n=1 Tax=Rheinheimera sp. TaxID=1869214 RepID=UPI00307D0B96
MNKSWVVFFSLLAGLALVSPCQAFFAELTRFDKQQPQLDLSPSLYMQQTDTETRLEELVSDPERHHGFRLLSETGLSQINTQQAVWLFARLAYQGQSPADTILHYDFPLADQVEVYSYDRSRNEIQLLHRTGSQVPFLERGLPYRSFAFAFHFEPGQEVDVFIRVLDAGIVPLQLVLWQQQDFVLDQLYKNILDGLLCGVLLLMAFYKLFLFAASREAIYLYFSGFFFGSALVLAILNGLAFALLWPGYPEINQAILYVATGGTLACLSLFSWAVIQKPQFLLGRFSFALCLCSAMLLLFSPLYLSNTDRYWLLLASVGFSVLVNLCFACWYALRGGRAAQAFALGWFLFFGCILLLALSQTGYLPAKQSWQALLLMAVTGSMALMSYNLLKQQRDLQVAPVLNPQLRQLQQYHDIFHNAVEGMFTSTTDGQLINANSALLRILGYDSLAQMKADVSRSSMSRYYANPADRQRMLQQLQHDGNKNFEIKGLRADGTPFWALMSARLSVHDQDQTPYVHGSIIDITEQKRNTEQLDYLANHDSLTSQYNRHYLMGQLQLQLGQPSSAVLLYLDIDQFKLVNTTCDHTAGDALLCQLSNQLLRVLAGRGVLARLESDEFAVLLPGQNSQQAFAVAYQLLDSAKEYRFIWQDSVFNVSLSIGMAEKLPDEANVEHWLKRADAASFVAKEKGRNRIHLFNPDDDELKKHQKEVLWLKQLRQALAQDQFVLYSQQVQALQHQDKGLHYELLLRMQLEDGSLIPPGSFLTSAERYGLMPQIDRWVLKQYFRWLCSQPAHLEQLWLCNINLSGASLTDPLFKAYVLELFQSYRIPYHKICFEVTESMAILNLQHTLDFMASLRACGCRFALDDFGSGFSSYSYLKNLPVDFIKIDGNFVRDLLQDPFDRAIVQSIHDIATVMDIQTVAEFVESQEIAKHLTDMGINFGQGYGIAKPQPLYTNDKAPSG